LDRWRFVSQSLLLSSQKNGFQKALKGECFFNDFEALVREIAILALVGLFFDTMRSRNIILKVVSSKSTLIIHFTESRYMYWNDDFCPEARVNVSNIFVLCCSSCISFNLLDEIREDIISEDKW
jgi:hypothetical protein